MRVAFAALSLCSVLLGCRDLPTAGGASASELPLREETLVVNVAALRVGVVRGVSDPITIAVPATARIGEAVVVRITTYGGGCVGPDTTVASTVGLRALIVPYQRVFTVPSQVACTDDLRLESRAVSVTFTSVGEAIVRIVGRAASRDALIAVERRVSVR